MLYNNKFKILFIILITFVILIITLLLVYIFIGKPIRVNGESMTPNYNVGEYYFVNYAKPQKHGDVVAYNFVTGPQKHLLMKRVLGFPGNTVMIKNQKLYINGKKLNEAEYNIPAKTPPGVFIKNNITYKVPEGSYFLIGDYRDRSNDSRNFGFIKETNIIGVVTSCVWKCN